MAADVADVPRGASAEQRLLEHAKYFDRLMSFLPANLTQKPSTTTALHTPLLANTEYMHNKKGTPTPKLDRALKKQGEQQSRKLPERPEHDSDDDDSDDSDDHGEEDEKEEEMARGGAGEGASLSGFSNDIADREVLKQRLRERLEELKKKRKAPDEPDAEGPAKKKRRLEDKKKEKRRKEKEAASAASKVKKPAATPAPAPPPAPTPATADIEFAQFDFGTDSSTDPRARREKKPLSKKQRLQRALEVAQARQAARKEHGVESDASAAWAGMMARARGEKVLDDVARIKKTLRQDERKKKKSAKEWNERLDMQKKAQAARLKQRERNIAERKKAKTKGKGKKGKRVGFEGGVRK